MIGQEIENYKILEKIGAGGMGAVYRGHDMILDREVAVKVVHGQLAHPSPIETRSHKEASAQGKLNHPNIACLYNLIRYEDDWLIVMEFVPGEPLQAILARTGAMPLAHALPLFVQILDGIAHAHQRGIIHRDIKPGNVMVNDDNQVKIVDFGLAKVQDRNLTQTMTTMGTVAYMSPEQARGEFLDHRTDIWSLGIVLYEMLAGRRPFQGVHEHAVLYSILHKTPPPLPRRSQDTVPAVPKMIERILFRALDKDPASRFQTVDAFRNALEDATQRLAVSVPLPEPFFRKCKPLSPSPGEGEHVARTPSKPPEAWMETPTLLNPPRPSLWKHEWIRSLAGLAMLLLMLALSFELHTPDKAVPERPTTIKQTHGKALAPAEMKTAPDNPTVVTIRKPAASRVARLLAQAHRNVEALQFITPAADNALAKCDSVLQQEEANQEALSLLEQMAAMYEFWGDEQQNMKAFEQARANYKKGLFVIEKRAKRFATYYERVMRKQKQVEALLIGSAAVVRSSPRQSPSEVKTVFLTRGTVISLRLAQTLDAEDGVQTGTPVLFNVAEDISVGGQILIEEGASVVASISRARRGRKGYVYFAITTVESIDGRRISVSADPEPGVQWTSQKRRLLQGARFDVLVSRTIPVQTR